MYIFKLFLTIWVLQFTYISNAQISENCYSGYKRGSAEQNACIARNQDRYMQERRYQEDQDAKKIADEKQKSKEILDSIKANKRQEEEIEMRKKQEAQEYYRDLERKQAAGQLNGELTEAQVLKLQEFSQLLKETTVFVSIASKPWAVRATELSKAGKCKESRALIEKETKNADKSTRATAEYIQGSVAEECDMDELLALKLYSRAAKNGSFMGKEKLKEYFEK